MSNYILVDGELYHHGVKGMKWGVRKRFEKTIARRKARSENVRETAKRIGVANTTARILYKRGFDFMTNTVGARVINSAANVYISRGRGSYQVKKGVDFVRKAAIAGLSVREIAQTAQTIGDIKTVAKYGKDRMQARGEYSKWDY